MKICIVIGEPRRALGARATDRPPRRAVDEQLLIEDALLAFGRAAASDHGAVVVAAVVGGRPVRGAARHALTAGAAEVLRVPVADLGGWPDADAARLVAAVVGHVGADLTIVGAEEAGGWDRLAGQVAELAGVGLCTAMTRVAGAAGPGILAEHDFCDERLVLRHDGALVSTAARSLLWSAPTFAYDDVVASRDRVVTELALDELSVTAPSAPPRLRTQPRDPGDGRRAVVAGGDVIAAATHFLHVIGAVR